MRPNLKDVFDNPFLASIDLTEKETFVLGKMIARNTTIENVNNVVIYCNRLLSSNLDAVRVILNAILDQSGGFKSPLLRANNSALSSLLEDYLEDSLAALEELNDTA